MEQIKRKNREQGPTVENVLGWSIKYSNEPNAPWVDVDRTSISVVVNSLHIPDREVAYRMAAFAVAKEVATLETFRGSNPKEAARMFASNPDFIRELLYLTGARILKERDAESAKHIAQEAPLATSALSEFRSACAEYMITGTFPNVTARVQEAIDSLPTSPKTGEHLLSTLTSETVTLARKRDYFDRFIAPAVEALRQVDADLRASNSEDFKPSTDDNEGKVEILDEDIEQRVEPFVGGYYREKVMDAVDWQAMSVVASGVPEARLQAPDEPRVRPPQDENKLHTFSGKNGMLSKDRAVSLPLPGNANVLPESLAEGWAIRQAQNGTNSLEWLGEGDPPEDYQFTFERVKEALQWRHASPTELEQGVPDNVVATLLPETQAFLQEMQSAHITDEARVRQVASRVQRGIVYVSDSAVGDALAAAGQNYFAELERSKKGDCDVTNFYALALLRALGIPTRMIVGYHIKKNKKFNFAALAGDKHAWLEWWDETKGTWERVDATPPAPPEEDDGESDPDGGSGGSDMKIGNDEGGKPKVSPDDSDDDPWGTPLGEDELARLGERIAEITKTAAGESGAAAARIKKAFEDLYGVSEVEWEKVRRFAEDVARERIPREATAEQLADSTVGEEWRHILDLLLVAYRLPSKTRRTMGRESQGGFLTDPVSAGVDIMLGAEDPYGYEVKKSQERIRRLPIRFSNDFLLDVTASMEAKNRQGKSLLELERQFVLSSLYEGYRLNERIKQHESELSQKPIITNHVLSIHGEDKWQEIIKTEAMSLGGLALVSRAFNKPTSGAGAMAEAIEAYVETLENDQPTQRALKEGDMVKTLTIITDGNLWCSSCGKESCNYEFHGPTLARVQIALEKIRGMGVIINAIGFTEQSRPVAELFAVSGDPVAAVVTEDLSGALVAHHTQVLRAMKPALDMARKHANIV